VATAATLSQVALPEMKRLNYSDRLAAGTVAVGGTLGILIPPSVVLIIYGLLAEQSIIKLFAAAFIPGLMAAVGYIAVIAISMRIWPDQAAPRERAPWNERIAAINAAWPIIVIFLVMFIGIYGGFFTATEGAAVGTVATLLLGFSRRALSWNDVIACFLPTAQATAMIFLVLLGAAMLNTTLAVSQIPNVLADWVGSLNLHPLIFISGFLMLFVILCSVLDELAMMMLLLPILLPTLNGLDLFGLSNEYKLIWFGILMLAVIAIGLVMPPIGLNVYVVSNIAKNIPVSEIYRGIMPFLVWDVIRVALLILFPSLSLYMLQFVK
jgi:tripartite ATP-independent transporter DctM subunit